MDDALFAVRRAAEHFDLAGPVTEVRPHGEGHIHASFRVRARRDYLLQRLNTHVVRDVDGVTENIVRVCTHLRTALAKRGATDLERRVLGIVPTRASAPLLRTARAEVFRMYTFVPDARSFGTPHDSRLAFEAGRVVGEFHELLSDFGGPPLRATFVGFHDTEARLASLREAVRVDCAGRVAEARVEIDFVESRAALAGIIGKALSQGACPSRVAHNDTKLDNVLFDERSERGLCLVDLDTVMNGSWLHDVGDLGRSLASGLSEDERDLARIGVHLPHLEAMARGYASQVGSRLAPAEWELMPEAPKIIALELAIRFLTDHLDLDRYFPVARPGHNLERARAQLRLVQELERCEPALRALWSKLRSSHASGENA